MYIPKADEVSTPATLAQFMRENSFAVLISTHNGAPVATHLPLLFDETRGAHGTLLGHMARANPQWQQISGEVLAVFHGPHAYISPTWYGEPGFVPTWNYAAVHAYGTVRLLEDLAATKQILQQLVDFYERAQPQPWKIEPPDRFDYLVKAIVAFEIPITRLEGKWKLSGTHTPQRRARVAAQLKLGDESSCKVGALMEANLKDPGA